MSDKYFLDTNILIYTFDSREKKKRTVAMDIVEDALSQNSGIISFQVVQEFLNVATRKFSKPMSVGDAKEYLNQVLMPLCEIYPHNLLYQSALTIAQDTGYSWYDSLIIASAQSGNCNILYSEDLHDSHKISGLSIINPF
jgi:predicted nucleic acid-binding protein